VRPKRMAILMGLLAGASALSDGALSEGIAAEGAKRDKKPASAAKAPPPDVKFLEYLGTLEGEGENWTDVAAPDLLEQVKGDAKAKAAAKPEKK
jgi:hypothetical protein